MWAINYYNEKVFNEIKELPSALRGRYVALMERMCEYGPNLGMPHTRSLGNGLFELRIKAMEGIARVFYCTKIGNEIIVLHSFLKKTQKIPRNELELANKRLKEVKNHD